MQFGPAVDLLREGSSLAAVEVAKGLTRSSVTPVAIYRTAAQPTVVAGIARLTLNWLARSAAMHPDVAETWAAAPHSPRVLGPISPV